MASTLLLGAALLVLALYYTLSFVSAAAPACCSLMTWHPSAASCPSQKSCKTCEMQSVKQSRSWQQQLAPARARHQQLLQMQQQRQLSLPVRCHRGWASSRLRLMRWVGWSCCRPRCAPWSSGGLVARLLAACCTVWLLGWLAGWLCARRRACRKHMKWVCFRATHRVGVLAGKTCRALMCVYV